MTSILALEVNANVGEYNGGFDDWLKHQKSDTSNTSGDQNSRISKGSPDDNHRTRSADRKQPQKLSYNEQRTLKLQKQELDALPERIEEIETELHQLQLEMADSTFYQQEEATIIECTERMKSLEENLEEAYRRWQELEKIMDKMSFYLETES